MINVSSINQMLSPTHKSGHFLAVPDFIVVTFFFLFNIDVLNSSIQEYIFFNCVYNFTHYNIVSSCLINFPYKKKQDKVCVLVTHQIQYLKKVQHVVLMNLGRIEAQGSYSNVKRTHYDSIRTMTSVAEVEKIRRETEKQELQVTK